MKGERSLLSPPFYLVLTVDPGEDGAGVRLVGTRFLSPIRRGQFSCRSVANVAPRLPHNAALCNP